MYSLFPGPPDPPSLTILEQHVDLELRILTVVWDVPYSHPDHPISHYDVTVTNVHKAEADSLMSESSDTSITLPFPHQTSSCDVLTVTVTAVNDIGASKPAQANVSIPEGITQF